ncbi:hypothetical protein Rsub_08701 [Raphidocelis subcapitata]|uniref:Beta'-coat protein n=1 Tax=Raphidocelis subcapitata TaxID=307507 RepID=A0A2V0P834_9CHLO|nr:hypothetical protein Rsub_08701 [Raphidocelis subcapitata]|eukprot:GBF95719.1 hypothetical protein Rsub_08701 [Raphidocelis subcapitata]
MPLRLEVKKQLVQRTERVKGVDLHPTEPWLLANLYNGTVYLWNYNDSSLVKSFEVTELPVRTAKFVPRKQWIVAGADDMMVRVYNYNTMDKVRTFEAHSDYIRSIAVHPTLPYALTSSDDMLIKLWDWERGWACVQVFEGHSHYVMQVVFNPKDTNTFASASLDRTVKVWSLGQPTPNFTLEGHEKGVNCVDYFTGGDRPFLISGADDKTAKVWDYQTKACVQTLEGHSHNISCVSFHPELPIILTGSEDGSVKMWHATTYRLENTLNYGMERVWALGTVKGSNMLALGFDEGVAALKIGREEPVASMDASGKIIWARHNEVQTVNVKSLGAEYEVVDGERLPLAVKDLGACDLYPQSLRHNPNGRFVTVCGDGEYVVYTALAWRNKSFGSALEFAWSSDSNEYAVREAGSRVKIFKNFQERQQLRIDFPIEGLHGGALVGARGAEFVCFYDWGEGRLVRRIDVGVRDVIWSDGGELVAIIGNDSFYILSFNRAAVDAAVAGGVAGDEDGIEDAFELLAEVPERVRTGLWVGDCFIYNNAAWRLNYCVGGEVTTMYHLDRPMYLLGYLAAQGRVYLIDREFSVVSYTLLLALVEEFSVVSYTLLLALWRQLGELAMARGQLGAAADCLRRAADLSGLLLLHAAQGDRKGLSALAAQATAGGRSNVAFLCAFLLGDTQRCVSLLLECGRLPEAAMFARAYLPSRMSECVKEWKTDLATINAKAAEALGDPGAHPELFPALQDALSQEGAAAGAQTAAARQPAAAYAALAAALAGADGLSAQLEALGLDAAAAAALPPPPPAFAAAPAAAAAPPSVNGAAPAAQQQWGAPAAAAAAAAAEEGDDGSAFFGGGSGYAPPAPPPQQQQPPPPAAPAFAAAAAPAFAAAAAAAQEEEEEDDDFFHEPEPAAAAAPPPPPAFAPQQPPAAAAAAGGWGADADAGGDLLGLGGDDGDEFGFDEPAAAAAGAGAGAAGAGVDLDDDWGLDGEDEAV